MTTVFGNEGDSSYPHFYRQLRSYLKTQMELSSFESTPKETGRQQALAKVKVMVSNTAPALSDWPKVVFMGVGLSVMSLGETRNTSSHRFAVRKVEADEAQALPGTPWQQDDKFKGLSQTRYHRVHGQDFPDATPDERTHGEVLYPGQSVIFEMDVPPQVIPYLQFQVDATVSRRHLFHHQETLVMPETLTKPIALAALSDFNALDLHRVLDLVITSMPDLGADTRLAEVQAFSAALTNGITETKVIQEAMSKLWHEHKMFWFQAHLRAAHIYLDHVNAALARMREAIGSNTADKIVAEASLLQALKGEAAQFNRMTEELMNRHNISHEEVGYRYRDNSAEKP
jgi:hypothetical protein